jgi:hypothetical protein
VISRFPNPCRVAGRLAERFGQSSFFTQQEQVAWTLFYISAWALFGSTAATNFGACAMSDCKNMGLWEETALDRAIVRQDDQLKKVIDNSYNFLHDMCMKLIDEKCELQKQVNILKHELAMIRLDRLGKEHDEC